MYTDKVFTFSRQLLLPLLFGLVTCYAFGQDSKSDGKSAESETMETKLGNKSFVFKPQSVQPVKAGTRQLNPGYTLEVRGDTLICYLPYFGRVYQATTATDAGLDFTSYQFDYRVKARKKSGWDIMIKTKDQRSQRQFSFTVFENGSTSLNVISNDRESISYQGRVEAKAN